MERLDIFLLDQANSRLREGEGTLLPGIDSPTADGRNGLERRVGGVQQLFPCRDEFALSAKRIGCLILTVWC